MQEKGWLQACVTSGEREVIFQVYIWSFASVFAHAPECCPSLQKPPLCSGHPSWHLTAQHFPRTPGRFEKFQIYDSISPGRTQKLLFPNSFAAGEKHRPGFLRCTRARLGGGGEFAESRVLSGSLSMKVTERRWVYSGRRCDGPNSSSPAVLEELSLLGQLICVLVLAE